MKNIILFSAFALAEFLMPYGDDNNFLVESYKDKVAVLYGDSEFEINSHSSNAHEQILEFALSFSKDEIEKESIQKDWALFSEREHYLNNLPNQKEEESEILEGLSEDDKQRFEAFREFMV